MTSRAPDSNKPRIYALDFFRSCAVIGIFLVHVYMFGSQVHTELHRSVFKVFRNFWVFTDLLLVLSGFLMAERYFADTPTRNAKNSLRWMFGRWNRLFLPYLVVLTVLYTASILMGSLQPLHWKELLLLTNAPFQHDNFLSWSWNLSLFAQVSLISPLIFWFLKDSQTRRVVLLLFVTLLLLTLKIVTHSKMSYTPSAESPFPIFVEYTKFYLRFDGFLWGIFLYYMAHSKTNSIFSNRKLLKFPITIMSSVILVIALTLPSHFPFIDRQNGFLFALLIGSLLAFAFSGLYYSFHDELPRAGRPLFEFISIRSYSYYLTHIPIIGGVALLTREPLVHHSATTKFLVLSASSLLAIVAISELFYRLVEKPLVSWSRRWTREDA